jgi:uncharacterized membrane protein YkoI
MNRTKKLLIVGGAVAAIGASGAAVATGAVGGDSGEQAKGPEIDKAKAAALAITGGKVNAAERDNEKGATYEVEVTKPDGKVVDVRLDGSYKQVAIDSDQEDGGSK